MNGRMNGRMENGKNHSSTGMETVLFLALGAAVLLAAAGTAMWITWLLNQDEPRRLYAALIVMGAA